MSQLIQVANGVWCDPSHIVCLTVDSGFERQCGYVAPFVRVTLDNQIPLIVERASLEDAVEYSNKLAQMANESRLKAAEKSPEPVT